MKIRVQRDIPNPVVLGSRITGIEPIYSLTYKRRVQIKKPETKCKFVLNKTS